MNQAYQYADDVIIMKEGAIVSTGAPHDILTPVMEAVCQKIEHYMEARTHGAIRTGAVVFSNVYGVLGYTSQAKDLLAVHQKGEVR